MKYLFFDIECSNSYDACYKMCEFGYVLTDENFNVIKSEDIPMSPGRRREDRFDHGIFLRDPTFQFAYDEDYYFGCNEFPAHYEKIKSLIEQPDVVVVGWGVENDINYLYYSCKRYELEPCSFIAYDISPFAKEYLNNNHLNKKGLKGLFTEMYGNPSLIGLTPHLSRDDAYMTMMVCKGVFASLGKNIHDLERKYPNAKYDSIEFSKISEERHLLNQTRKRFAQKLQHYLDFDSNNGKEFVMQPGTLYFDFSLGMRENQRDLVLQIAKTIKDRGFHVRKDSKINYLVVENDDEKCFLKDKTTLKNVKLIDTEELKTLLESII